MRLCVYDNVNNFDDNENILMLYISLRIVKMFDISCYKNRENIDMSTVSKWSLYEYK